MCTHPDDETVQILENGVSDRARFSFKMFRFTESFSYIYLHCEVKVCNSTAETCVGSQGLCHGMSHQVESYNYFTVQAENGNEKRDLRKKQHPRQATLR